MCIRDSYKADGEETEGTGADNEIWSYGEENYQIMKKFIEIREMMRDYTRSLMAEAHETGAPVMRTMFYEFPEDLNTWELDTQYMYCLLYTSYCPDSRCKKNCHVHACRQRDRQCPPFHPGSHGYCRNP